MKVLTSEGAKMKKNVNYEIVKSSDLGFLTMEVTYSVNQTGGLHKQNFIFIYYNNSIIIIIMIMSFFVISY